MKDFIILALDDDEMFCSLLESLAKRESFTFSIKGYRLVLTVFNDMKHLDDAMTFIRNEKPDLVLLDYFLEPYGCVASLDILKKVLLCCATTTEIVLMTGMYAQDVRFELLQNALVKMDMEIIQKPFTIAELIKVINGSIKRKENE